LESLETFEFAGYIGTPEERDFLSYIFKHARCLKSSSILSRPERYHGIWVLWDMLHNRNLKMI